MARRQRKAMTRDNVILIKSFFMADNSATTKDAVKIFGYAPRTITGVCRAEYDRCLEERDLLKWGGVVQRTRQRKVERDARNFNQLELMSADSGDYQAQPTQGMADLLTAAELFAEELRNIVGKGC